MVALDEIERLCRDASYGEYEWASLLEKIAEHLNGDSSMLMHRAGHCGYNESLSYNHDPYIADLYNHKYYQSDPRAQRSLRLKVGQVSTGQQIVPNSEFQHTAYYSDITLAANVKDSLHGVITDDDEFGRRAISIQCGFKNDFFDRYDLSKIQSVMPHLASAMRDSVRLTRITTARVASDSLFYGLIDPAFNMHFFDRPDAIPLAGLKEDLALSGATVTGGSRAKAISTAIKGAAAGKRCTLQLTKYQLALDNIPPALDWAGLDRTALFVVSKRKMSENPLLFTDAFGLTVREADILNLLIQLEDRTLVCAQAAISHETLRSHIKNILSKTGYDRMSKLASAISNNDLVNSL